MVGKIVKMSIAAGFASMGAIVSTPSFADGPISICLSLDKMSSPSRDGQVKLWRSEAKELGVKLMEQVAGEDAQRQAAQVDTCIAQGVAGIVSIPWDYEAVLQDIERAHAANIPFVTVDQAPAETDTVDFHTGADPYADGRNAARRLIALVGDKPTKVVDLQGALSHFNGQGRDKGFKDGIKDHANITLVAEIPTEWRPEPVLSGMENALQAHPDLGAVYSASDGLLPPVWSALKKANRYAKAGDPNHVIVLSIDGDPQGCQAVTEGYMDGGYAQPFAAMTRSALEAAINLSKGRKIESKDRVSLIPSLEYTPGTVAGMGNDVWGCVK